MSEFPTPEEQKTLIRQIQSEYDVCYTYKQPKWKDWSERLKLYCNQKRDKKAIGEPVIFTIHQTVLASLYEGKLSTKFIGKEQSDNQIADNLNMLAVSDCTVMDKERLDYNWSWDATFFGVGLVHFQYFDRKTLTPIPVTIDPMAFLHDPRAQSINGDALGNNRSRFCGYEVYLTKNELEAMPDVYTNIDQIKDDEGDNNIKTNRDLRLQAQGYSSNRIKQPEGENKEYPVLRWFTMFRGKRVLVEVANNRKTVVRFQEMKDNNIPIIARYLFPMAHDFDGISIPDLVEDKQRAEAMIMNLSLDSARAGLNHRFIYDKTKIRNRNDLNLAFNKHIGVKGNTQGVVTLVQHQSIASEVQWILSMIDNNAQKATATPDIQQGMTGQQGRTATELNRVAIGVDTRYSLMAKVFGWSEKEFWLVWYSIYKDNYADKIDKKIVRIIGKGAKEWKGLTREQIIARKYDPDVEITSEVLSETKRIKQMQAFANFINLALAFPECNKLYTLRLFGEINGLDAEDINIMLPSTSDENDAYSENELINKGKNPEVLESDNHQIHIVVHSECLDNELAVKHIKRHQFFLGIQKAKELEEMKKQQEAQLNNGQPSNIMPEQMAGISKQQVQPIQALPLNRRA